MLNVILTSLGIILLLFGVYLELKYSSVIYSINRKLFFSTIFLICLFIFGYLFFLFDLLREGRLQSSEDLLVALVFLGGSIFVVLIIRINKILINKIIESNKKIEETNKQLNEANTQLEDNNIKLMKESVMLEEDKEKITGNFMETEKLNKIMMGRELKMADMKREIEALENKADNC